MAENSETGDKSVPADIAKLSFEEALAELETIVRGLEGGEGALEAAIAAYDRGAALKRHCEAKLRDAQEKIEKIALTSDGTPMAEAAELD